MTNWMRRRIERSRARCEKSAADPKPDKEQGDAKQPKHASAASRGDEKDG